VQHAPNTTKIYPITFNAQCCIVTTSKQGLLVNALILEKLELKEPKLVLNETPTLSKFGFHFFARGSFIVWIQI